MIGNNHPILDDSSHPLWMTIIIQFWMIPVIHWDGYTSLDVASINSQVNKQANAGLQRIKGRIAYMNFVLCKTLSWIAKYRDKQSKLDVGNPKL